MGPPCHTFKCQSISDGDDDLDGVDDDADGGDDGGDEKDESCDLSLWQQVAPPASIALLSHPGQIMAAFAQSFD